jgi:hypothetical protein
MTFPSQRKFHAYNAVSIAIGYGLHGRGIGFRFPTRKRDFYLHHIIQTGCGDHVAPYPMGTWDLFSLVKRPGREADHSHPSNDEVKNTWLYTFTPPRVFMA